jgi:hypothetical protein
LQFLQFRRSGICCRIVAQKFVAEFFCYFEFVAIFCSSEEEEFVAEFFCCFEFVAAIFFSQVAEFLFCFGVWNCSNLFCTFRRRDFAAEFCVVLTCVVAGKFFAVQ